MKATEAKLLDFLKKSPQFVIPIYQRTYSWTEKECRQIVMVTHNPNLAVVCDADQIICAEMQKDHENAVTYISGSIEDPIINGRIVDILEGTRPAFDKRDDKYLP